MGSKIDRIAKIFDSVEHPKNRGVTYWAKNIMPLFVQIIDLVEWAIATHGMYESCLCV